MIVLTFGWKSFAVNDCLEVWKPCNSTQAVLHSSDGLTGHSCFLFVGPSASTLNIIFQLTVYCWLVVLHLCKNHKNAFPAAELNYKSAVESFLILSARHFNRLLSCTVTPTTVGSVSAVIRLKVGFTKMSRVLHRVDKETKENHLHLMGN